jgi:hypothetical protein
LSTNAFFDAIEITGWSFGQPRNDAEVFINIGVGGRILSDLSLVIIWTTFWPSAFVGFGTAGCGPLCSAWASADIARAETAATSFSFINGSPNGDYKAGSLAFDRPGRREAARFH